MHQPKTRPKADLLQECNGTWATQTFQSAVRAKKVLDFGKTQLEAKKRMKKGNKYANRVLPSAKPWAKAPLLLTTKSQWRWCCKCSNQLCQPALSSPSLGSRFRGCSGVRPTSKRHWDLESWHGPSWRRRHPNTNKSRLQGIVWRSYASGSCDLWTWSLLAKTS